MTDERAAFDAKAHDELRVLRAMVRVLEVCRRVNRERGPLHVKALLYAAAARYGIDLDSRGGA